MKVRAPGKLILSGEHSIVYGLPALATAIACYAEATVEDYFLPIISFEFGELAYFKKLSLSSLRRLKVLLKSKYQRFLCGEFNIRQVLLRPIELAQFACGLLLDMRKFSHSGGAKIKLTSDIPIGCGMGSSAAIILAIIYALAHQWNLACSPEQLLDLGQEIENLQHGHSSGLDLRISQGGGCFLLQNNIAEPREFPSWPIYMVNTGVPLSSTGECVSHVAPFFHSARLRQQFQWVTETMDVALQDNNHDLFQEMVQYNHELLVEIGVVPKRVQNFIAELVKFNSVAKICGAGSVVGESGGVLLVVTPTPCNLIELCKDYKYSFFPMISSCQGVHIV